MPLEVWLLGIFRDSARDEEAHRPLARDPPGFQTEGSKIALPSSFMLKQCYCPSPQAVPFVYNTSIVSPYLPTLSLLSPPPSFIMVFQI